MNDLFRYLWLKCGDFPYSTLWFNEDGSIPAWWIPGPAKYGEPHEPMDFSGNVLVRFTALRFPA